MPISDYMRSLRDVVGHRLLLVPAVAVIVRDNDRILILRKAEDRAWSLPAGAINPGESPQDAVVRETAEETGLELTSVRLIAVVGGEAFRTCYPNGDEVEFTVCMFEGEVRSYKPVVVDGEATAFRWVEAARVAGLLDLPYPEVLFVAQPA